MSVDMQVLSGVLALALASMVGFAVRRRAGRVGGPGPQDERSFVLGPFFRDWFFWSLEPVLRLSLAVGATPFFFNALGLAFGVAAGASIAAGHVGVGGWLILLGGVCDSLDGRVARARGVDGPEGAFLDSVLDRFSEVAVFVGLAVVLSSSAVGVPLVIAALGGSLLVSYTRARGESLGVECSRGVMQRAERLVVLGLAAIGDAAVGSWTGQESPGALLLPAVGLVALGTLATAVYRTLWIAGRLADGPST